jgi:ATP-binding cassette, subfamily F, member 3
MLTAHQLSKSFGIQTLFQDVSFSVNRGERVGLIGPNGSGKTTLLRILAGTEQADSGHVARPHELRLGYLPQGLALPPEWTLAEVIGRAGGDAAYLEAELGQLAAALAVATDDAALHQRYDQTLQQLSRFDEGRAATILQALALDHLPRSQPVGTLSGGQKTRLALARVLLDEPDLLLLDEPTNHLDIPMLEWLESWLSAFPGGALVVSHDRTFLDRSVNRILALDEQTRTMRAYTGNYTDYLEQVLAEREKQWGAYQDQVFEIRQMRQDIARIKEQARRTETATKNDQLRRYAKKVAAKAKGREKKLERYLEAGGRVEKPARSWEMKLDFGPPAHLGQQVLRLEQMAVGYPGQPPLLRDLDLQVRAGQRLVLTGPNGSGKTTLLRTIAGQLPPLAGHITLGASVRLGYMAQEQTALENDQTGLEMIQRAAPLNETEARNFLHFFLFSGDDPLRPAAALSYGERARLALALLVAQGCNFLLLDEPINHLDIPSRSRFEEALARFEGTVLAVVHDRYFIDRFATELWVVEGDGVRRELRESF